MLSTKIENLLNEKLNTDFQRSNLFLDISGWAGDLSLKGVQGYFLQASEKSLAEVNSLVTYLNEAGHGVNLGEIPEGLRDFDNAEDVFVYVQELEKDYRAKLNNLLDACLAEKDFATYTSLSEQAKTQHGEEFFLKSVLDKFRIVGNKGQGLYLIDKDLAEQYPISTTDSEA